MPLQKKKPRKKKSKIYFGTPVQEAILEYLDTKSYAKRNKIYSERIMFAFEKLAENIIHTFKFYYFDVDSVSVKHEVVAFLVLNMHKYDPTKGRAFSYFSVVAKNWLILNNNRNYKMYKLHSGIDSPKYVNKMINTEESRIISEQTTDFFEELTNYLELNLTSIFKRKKDIAVADSVLYLMKTRQMIENFNKKALYVLIREMTGSDTQHITRVINVIKKHYKTLHNEYSKNGYIETKSGSFSSFR
jgi:hypothetical protein